MKKMLFICMVGSLFITSMATAGEVVSTNIVGYINIPLVRRGFTFTGPTFVPVLTDGSAAKLGDVVSANDIFSPFEDSIQIFNAAGGLVAKATYISQAVLDEFEIEDVAAGWWDLDDVDFEHGDLNDTPLKYGWSVTAYTQYSGATLIYAGEVVQGINEIPLGRREFTFTCNTSPVDLTLGDIIANDNFSPFEDSIQIFDSNGDLIAKATYISQALLDEFEIEEVAPGWWSLDDVDFEHGDLNHIAMPAGRALTAYTQYANASLIVPSPMN